MHESQSIRIVYSVLQCVYGTLRQQALLFLDAAAGLEHMHFRS